MFVKAMVVYCLLARAKPGRRCSPAFMPEGESSTTVSRSDIRLMQHFGSSALGLVRRKRLIGYFPTHLLPLKVPLKVSAAQGNLTSCLNFDFAILNLFEPSAP
jgi:hypothetical protein